MVEEAIGEVIVEEVTLEDGVAVELLCDEVVRLVGERIVDTVVLEETGG